MKKKCIACLLAAMLLLTMVSCTRSPEESSQGNTSTTGSGDVTSGDETSSTAGESNGSESEGSATENNGSRTGSNSTAPTKSGTSPTQSGERKLVGNTYTTGFPIVEKKEAINIMAITRPDVGDVSKSQFAKSYAQMTNMDINWTLVTESQAVVRKTLALQSGALPDVFALGGYYVTQYDMLQYSAEGAFKEITKDMLQTYAPNITETYNDYPEAWKMATNPDDGKMYQLISFTKDNPYGQHFVWIRKNWLDALELSVPKTMDDFYTVLDSFKYDDPNGNGTTDEIPYATFSKVGFFTVPWGIGGYNNIVVDKDGKVTHAYATENMKKAATFWNKVYKENLVDKGTIDNWTGENAAFKTLIASGKVGAFFYGWPSGVMGDAMLKEYIPLPWPTAGDNGKYPSVYVPVESVPQPRSLIITKACKNPAAALRFIDYMYTNDGNMLGNYGNTYQKTSDTVYSISEAKTSEVLGPRWTFYGRNFLKNATLASTATVASAKTKDAQDTFAKQLAEVGKINRFPDMPQSKTELNQIKLYSTYFDSLSIWGYITGDSNLGTDWTALQNEMASKGLDKYKTVLQSYYDRVK